MGEFHIKKTPSGGFNFYLLANNKQKIAVSSQVYSNKQTCKSCIEGLGKHAARCIAEDRIEDQTLQKPVEKKCPKVEIYLDKAGLYRYRLIANNGECIAIAEEGYKSKDGCKNGIRSVAENATDFVLIDETKDK